MQVRRLVLEVCEEAGIEVVLRPPNVNDVRRLCTQGQHIPTRGRTAERCFTLCVLAGLSRPRPPCHSPQVRDWDGCMISSTSRLLLPVDTVDSAALSSGLGVKPIVSKARPPQVRVCRDGQRWSSSGGDAEHRFELDGSVVTTKDPRFPDDTAHTPLSLFDRFPADSCVEAVGVWQARRLAAAVAAKVEAASTLLPPPPPPPPS